MAVQFIETATDRMVVMPETEYREMVDAFEDAGCSAVVDRFREKLAAGDEELIPSEVVDRILASDNPVRVWREHRGMKTGDLAAAAGMSQAYVSQIESGKREGSVRAMKAIAAALNVTIDDIVA